MRQIRASFTDTTIRVYQAYGPGIADKAVKAQTFVAPFQMERMTWIKPSFFWMMYRCGWGMKPDQERVLAIDIARSGFEWALAHSCLSHFDRTFYASEEAWLEVKSQSPVRVQWDPERNAKLGELDIRAIQIGLSGEAVERYVREWIRKITDVTAFAQELHRLIDAGDETAYAPLIPRETVYAVSPEVGRRVGMTVVE